LYKVKLDDIFTMAYTSHKAAQLGRSYLWSMKQHVWESMCVGGWTLTHPYFPITFS